MYITANKALSLELKRLIEKNGFSEVLSTLETLASDFAEVMGEKYWEETRKNLENSVYEIEEYLISGNYN
jgi:hypothetical protein